MYLFDADISAEQRNMLVFFIDTFIINEGKNTNIYRWDGEELELMNLIHQSHMQISEYKCPQ
jgi:hypothetical protein